MISISISKTRLQNAYKIFNDWSEELLANKDQEAYNIGRYVEKIANEIETLIKVYPESLPE